MAVPLKLFRQTYVKGRPTVRIADSGASENGLAIRNPRTSTVIDMAP
jgi:hypothetical protein